MSELCCLEPRKQAVELLEVIRSATHFGPLCSLCYFLDLNSQRPGGSGLSETKESCERCADLHHVDECIYHNHCKTFKDYLL